MKWAFLSLVITLLLCIVGIFVSKHFWAGNTSWVYSYKYQHNMEVGWPVTLHSWSMWLGISIILILPFLYFMQDWKNPALALTTDYLFVNQQLLRNVIIPFKNIASVSLVNNGFELKIHNQQEILKQINILFKPFVKSNLANNTISFDNIHTGGDLQKIYNEILIKITKND